MSGLYGVVATNPQRLVTADLQAMQPAMRPWGQDRAGQWSGAGGGLGHQLQIETPEGRSENQPTIDPAGSGWRMVADARIDNRPDLIAKLSLEENTAQSLTDDQLIMKAWVCWGEGCFDRLVGAYAVVFWQESTRTLVAARDPMGFRPLVYHAGEGRFVFASEVNAVCAVSGVSEVIDESALLAFVHRHHSYFWDRTYLTAVKKLPPGHLLKWQGGDLEIRQYWHPEKIEINPQLTRKEGAVKLREVIDTAVRSHLRSVKPVGVHLSGGLDSSAILALADAALRERGEEVAAGYAWCPPPEVAINPRHPEYSRIRLMERQTGLTCQYCDITLDMVRDHWSRDPVIEPTFLRLYEEEVCRKAQAQGVGVLLSGHGGDEFASTGGRGFFADRLWSGRWIDLARWVIKAEGGSARGFSVMWIDVWKARPFWLRFGFKKGCPSSDPSVAYSALELRQIRRWSQASPPWRANVHVSMRRAWAHGHLQRRIEDWAAMAPAFGVSHRYPLLDQRVIETVLSFPDTIFRDHRMARVAMRRAFSASLPQAVCWGRVKYEPNRVGHLHRLSAVVCEEMLSEDDGDFDQVKEMTPLRRMYRRLAWNRHPGKSN